MAESVALSEQLNYGQVRQRAIAARNVSLKIPATNGNSFSMGQSITFQLPGNQTNSFYDMQKTGILLTLTNTASANSSANDGYLDGISGAHCLVDRLTVSNSSQILSDIQNYGVLVSALMTGETSKSYNMNVMANMSGAGSAGASKVGKVIAENSANPLTVFLPLICCSIANTQPQRLFPAFSAAPIEIRMYLNSIQNALVSAGTPVLSISSATLVTSMCVVSPTAGIMIDQMVNSTYRMLCSDFKSSTAVVTGTGAQTTATSTLGVSASSLDRLIWVARSADSQTQANNSIGARSTASCSEFQLFIGGVAYPDLPVRLDGTAGVAGYGAEGMANYLMSSGALHNFAHDSQFGVTIDGAADDDKFALVDSDGASEAKMGSSVFAIGLDTMPSSPGLFSGVSTVGQTVQLSQTFSALPAKAFEINVFSQITVQLELDTKGLRTWQISV